MTRATPVKHMVRRAYCLQPWIPARLEDPHGKSMYDKTTGEIDWHLLRVTGPRVWIATTDCGLAFHGEGAFPFDTLRFCVDDFEDPKAPAWCEKCAAEKWGYSPSVLEFGEPNLRDEFERFGDEKKKAVAP